MADEAVTTGVESAAPVVEAQVETQPQVESKEPAAAPKPEGKSLRDMIDDAFEQVEKGEPKPVEQKVEAKPEEKSAGERERNSDGTFKAKAEPQPEAKPVEQPANVEQLKPEVQGDAPARFSAEAKAAWKDTPAPVRDQVTRTVNELTAGLEKYRGDAQAFEPYRAFDANLKQTGQKFEEVLAHYTGIENLLRENPVEGLDRICRNLGTSLQQVAEYVLQQPADQKAARESVYVRQLEQKIQSLEQQVSGISTTIRDRDIGQSNSIVLEFAKSNPRFEELSGDIAFFLESGRVPRTGDYAKDLGEAYRLAELLNPAPQPAAQPTVQTTDPAQTRVPDAAQTRKGQASLSGAPGSGSNPASKKTPATARKAVEDAFASIGM